MLAIIAVVTMLFCVITPPFQVPDEPQHFSKSVHLAYGGVFTERHGRSVGASIPRGFSDLSELYFPHGDIGDTLHYDTQDLTIASMRRPADDDRVFIEFANVSAYAPTLYLPQALAIAAGAWFGVSPLGCFYMARWLNALVALALLGVAVRALPFGRPVLLAVAGLPTVAYHAASVSPDATINGLGFAVLALAIQAGYGQRTAVRRGRLIVLSALLGLCKGIYAPIALAGLRRGRLVPALLAAAAAVAAFLLWTLAAGGDQPVYDVVSRRTGKLVTTAPLSAQLHVVLAAPWTYLKVLGTSVVERSPIYGLQIVGRFGWNAILLPLVAYPLAAVMLAAGVCAGARRGVPVASRLWWAALALGMAFLIETALYLTGTPLGADYIQGTQGRYFLPILPLIGLAAMPRTLPSGWQATAIRVLIVTMAALNLIALATAIDSFWINGFKIWRGLPPLGDVVHALLLPSPRW